MNIIKMTKSFINFIVTIRKFERFSVNYNSLIFICDYLYFYVIYLYIFVKNMYVTVVIMLSS